MRCDWQFDGHRGTNTGFRCARCGVVAVKTAGTSDAHFFASMPECGEIVGKIAESMRRGSPTIEPPSMGRKAIRYSRAVSRWIAAGRPTRTEQEVERIYSTICQPCDRFSTRGSCNVCGCKVRRSGAALLNKLAMKTESCPLGKW